MFGHDVGDERIEGPLLHVEVDAERRPVLSELPPQLDHVGPIRGID